jgi:ribosomal-protein-serine acetyltransferase
MMFSFSINKDISIELLQQHHKEELFELIDSNRVHLREWLLWVDKRRSPSDFETIIPLWIRNYADNNGFDAGIRFHGELVGMVGLHYIDWHTRSTSIGYFLAEYSQGKGIISTVISALLEYLFTVQKLNRVVIQCAVNNYKSIRIPERLGFTKEGVIREGQWINDHYEDIVTYSLLKDEWKDRQNQ